MSRILALDQSSHISGYAIFDNGDLIKYGIFTCNEKDTGERLVKIRKTVLKFIQEYNVDEVVFEDIQLQDKVLNNINTFKILAEVFGVIYELVEEMNLANRAILSGTWRSGLGIPGKYRKEQKAAAQAFVKKAYGIEVSEDAADAICIGTFASFTNKRKIGTKVISNDEEGYDWSN